MLPQDEIDRLLKLKTLNSPEFKCRIKQLREVGWTLASIATALGAARSTVKFWSDNADMEFMSTQYSATSMIMVPHAPVKKKEPRVVKLRPQVPPSWSEDLKKLAQDAQKVRSGTSESSHLRHSAGVLDNQIEMLLERGVSARNIAEHMGVTTRAVKARMERRSERRV